MPIVCPSCQATYEDGATRFCGRCGSDLSSLQREPSALGADPFLGRVVDGRYRIGAKIGHGGMGSVYQVEHLAMGKQAAMKLLHPALSADPEVGRRFRREAEAVSRLSSPHTVQVFDFGQSQGLIYLVMELVRGDDLGAILRRDGPIRFGRARPILMQACESLSEAHEMGIVHRDLKPENLLVSRGRDGRDVVKVLDFGLAKLRDSEELTTVTARGALVGTPFYMSPEQIRGEDLDGRSDIYSMGALLYRALTGEHPFTAATPVAVLTQHLTEKLELPSRRRPDLNLDPIVDEIVGRAMAKERDDRYPSADALAQALEQAGQASPPRIEVSERPLERRERRDPTGQKENLKREDVDAYETSLRRRRWLGIGALFLLLGGGVTGAAVLRWMNAPRAADAELEPNDSPEHANLIARGKSVRGKIGKTQAGGPDRDFYTFAIDRGPQVLRVELTGIPTMDLKLEVFDGAGRRLADGDGAGVAGSETLPNVRLDGPGSYYVAVREVWTLGRAPTADDVNWYTMTATWRSLAPDEESEPDDTPAQAVPLALDVPMRGTLWSTNDVDCFYPRGEGGGALSGIVTGIDGVDLRIVVLPPRAGSGPPGPLPAGARVFDTGGPGAAERFSGIPWPLGSAGPIVIVERKDPAAGKRPQGERPPLVGVDTPYSLTVRRDR